MPPSEKPESEEELEARLRKLLGDESEEESELDRRARQLAEHPLDGTPAPHEELERIDAEFKGRISGVDERLNEAQERRKKVEAAQMQGTSSMSTNDAQGLGTGLSIAYAILGIPILFGVIGIGVDKAFGTALAGTFTVGGVVLAMGYVFFVLNRQNK